MIDRFGMHRFNDGDVIGDFARVREQLAQPRSRLAMLRKLELGCGDWESRLSSSHPGNALSHTNGTGQFFAMELLHRWFVIE